MKKISVTVKNVKKMTIHEIGKLIRKAANSCRRVKAPLIVLSCLFFAGCETTKPDMVLSSPQVVVVREYTKKIDDQIAMADDKIKGIREAQPARMNLSVARAEIVNLNKKVGELQTAVDTLTKSSNDIVDKNNRLIIENQKLLNQINALKKAVWRNIFIGIGVGLVGSIILRVLLRNNPWFGWLFRLLGI